MKKLDYIDTLRALAILGVVMVHCTQYGSFDVPTIMRNTAVSGTWGVQLFYIASAFTLFLSFDNRSGKELYPVRNFFIRRFFRIAPMYYIGVLYYLWQGHIGERNDWPGVPEQVGFIHVLTNATFVHGFSPYWIETIVPGSWSIAIEMTFYAVLPFLVFRIRNIRHAFNFLLIALILRAILVNVLEQNSLIANEKLWGEYLYLFFPSQLPIFALGILMYFIVKGDSSDLAKIPGQSLLIMSGLVLFDLVSPFQTFAPHILCGVGFLLLALALSKYRPKILVNPVFGHIGKISFSMYLIHFAVLYWMNEFGYVDFAGNQIINFAIRFIVVVLIAGAISTMFYYVIEVPFQRIGKNLIKALENRKQKAFAEATLKSEKRTAKTDNSFIDNR